MSKRARIKWPPRTRQPARAVKVTRINPIYGPANIDFQELHARLVNGKAY